MPKGQIGHLKPRYKFALNPYKDYRWSTCPICRRLNYKRKFAPLIGVEGFGPFVVGKTCRYCSKCEFIIAHQDELENVLADTMQLLKPEVIGNDYLVLGTVDMKVWKKGMEDPNTVADVLPHTADIKKYMTLH